MGGIVGRLDWDLGTNDKQYFFESCVVSGTLQNISSTYHIFIGGVVGIGFNGWEAADNVQTETPMVWFKNIFVDADIDISRATMANTSSSGRYARLAGITPQLGSYICQMENVHFSGTISGQNNSYLNQSNSAFAGIIANPRSNSVYKEVTTSFDKVTVNSVEYNTSGDSTSGIKNEKNWKGHWDRETCKVNVSDFTGIKEAILAEIANGYDIEDIESQTFWSGSVATGFSGGRGTKASPYKITNGSELAYLAKQVNWGKTFEGVYFKLVNDIDMKGFPFQPIGGEDDSHYFAGYFDGNNKTITNLNLMSEETTHFMNVGLFGCVKNAVVENLTLAELYKTEDLTARSYYNVGALIGKAISSKVVNCHVKSDLCFEASLPESQLSLYAGGLIGMVQDGGTVKGCTYDGDMVLHGRGDPVDIIEAPEKTLDLTDVKSIYYTNLGVDYRYVVGSDIITKFTNESKDSFLGVCKYYENFSYTLYSYNEMGNVLSATYVKANTMMHIYWVGGDVNELSVVKSTNAAALPPQTPDAEPPGKPVCVSVTTACYGIIQF